MPFRTWHRRGRLDRRPAHAPRGGKSWHRRAGREAVDRRAQPTTRSNRVAVHSTTVTRPNSASACTGRPRRCRSRARCPRSSKRRSRTADPPVPWAFSCRRGASRRSERCARPEAAETRRTGRRRPHVDGRRSNRSARPRDVHMIRIGASSRRAAAALSSLIPVAAACHGREPARADGIAHQDLQRIHYYVGQDDSPLTMKIAR
jgi:hypothetical protein